MRVTAHKTMRRSVHAIVNTAYRMLTVTIGTPMYKIYRTASKFPVCAIQTKAAIEIQPPRPRDHSRISIRVIDVDSLWDSASIFGPRVEKMNPPLGPGFPAISSSFIDSP
jgi:hypothetical protein